MPGIDTHHIWIKGIRTITECERDGTLHKKLGTWYQNPAIKLKYPDLMHKSGNHILKRTVSNSWNKYEKIQEKRGTAYFEVILSKRVEEYNHNEYVAVEIQENSKRWSINKREQMKILETKPQINKNKVNTLEEFIDRSDRKIEHLLDYMVMEKYQQYHEDQEITIVSDGSAVDDCKGSYGLVASIEKQIIATAKNRIPNIYGVLVSYRSECYGVLAAVNLFKMIILYSKEYGEKWRYSD
jgi:hypothetical protein